MRLNVIVCVALLLLGTADAASKKKPPPAPPAAPIETIEELRGPVIETCKSRMPPESAPTVGVAGACTCMVDGIIQQFGTDALSMLRIIHAGLDPSQIEEIAALLALKEDDAEKFVEMAQPKIEQIQAGCAK